MALLEWADVVTIGCGLGRNGVSELLFKGTIENCQVPCVVDADGLYWLSRHRDLLENLRIPVILTPHMKEMAGLLGCSVREVQEERFPRLLRFVEEYPVVCALKDARTIVAKKGERSFVNTAGNQSMAKAGSGDVLSGVITGMLSGGLSAYDGAVLGVFLHACGGDTAQKELGSYSVLAENLLEGIARSLKAAEEQKAMEEKDETV